MWKQIYFLILIFSIEKCKCENFNFYQLPNSTRPLKYELWLKVNIQYGSNMFLGYVKIYVKALKDTKNIILHSENLHIQQINLYREESTVSFDLSFDFDKSRNFLNISLPNLIARGKNIKI